MSEGTMSETPPHLPQSRPQHEVGEGTTTRSDETPVERAGLSARTANALRRAGLLTLTDVSDLHVSELEAVPNLGRKSLEEILARLRALGLTTRSNHHPRPTKMNAQAGREGYSIERSERTTPELARESPPSTAAGSGRAVWSDARRDAMVTLRQEGATLEEVGERFGITRERVRQILGPDAPSAKAAGAARRRRSSEAVEPHAGELLAEFRSGRDPGTRARELGLSAQAVRDLIEARATPADRAERKLSQSRLRGAGSRTYSDGQLTLAIHRVAVRTGGTPSSGEYARHAAEEGLPSLPTVVNRFGSWADAVRAAGMTPREARRRYTRHWTEERCRDAIRRLIDELGEAPTAEQYDVLASADDDLPSLATVRNRLGRWSEVIGRAVAKPHSHPILARIGVAEQAAVADRDEAVWLAHLEGEVSDAELSELLAAGLFSWDESFGPRPDA